MKKFISIIMTVLLVCSMTVSGFAEDSSTKSARSGIVAVRTYCEYSEQYEDQSGYTSAGNAFFVGTEGEVPGYLLTSYDTVKEYLENGAGEPVEHGHHSEGNWHKEKCTLHLYLDAANYLEAYVVAQNKSQNLALLRTEKPVEARTSLSLRTPDEGMLGKNIYVLGFSDDAGESAQAYMPEDVLVTAGVVGKFITEKGTGHQWIQLSNTQADTVLSGGPVIWDDGSVIGMTALYGEKADKQGYAVDSNAMTQFLTSNGIKYTVAADEPEEIPVTEPEQTVEEVSEETEEGIPATEPEQVSEGDISEEAEESDDEKKIEIFGYSVPLIPLIMAAAGILAVIIAAVIIISIKKKKAKKIVAIKEAERLAEERRIAEQRRLAAEEARREAERIAAEQKKSFGGIPTIRSAQHGGQKIKIEKNPILIGRSPECKIVFAESTPGVSAKHCEVSWDETTGDFILTDIGSTYGTFLITGQKLNSMSPYRLRNGDTFYLGKEENALRVELDRL